MAKRPARFAAYSAGAFGWFQSGRSDRDCVEDHGAALDAVSGAAHSDLLEHPAEVSSVSFSPTDIKS
jgi:hypothetical protein